jgi:hypothetical protein
LDEFVPTCCREIAFNHPLFETFPFLLDVIPPPQAARSLRIISAGTVDLPHNFQDFGCSKEYLIEAAGARSAGASAYEENAFTARLKTETADKDSTISAEVLDSKTMRHSLSLPIATNRRISSTLASARPRGLCFSGIELPAGLRSTAGAPHDNPPRALAPNLPQVHLHEAVEFAGGIEKYFDEGGNLNRVLLNGASEVEKVGLKREVGFAILRCLEGMGYTVSV